MKTYTYPHYSLRKLALVLFLFLAAGSTFAQSFRLYRPFNDPINLLEAFVLDSQNVYIAGEYGYILKTTDGGSSWATQNIGPGYAISTISFINADTGFAGGKNNVIIRTTNGGIKWTMVHQTNGTANEWIRKLFFVDNYVGYALNSIGQIYKTTDGGTDWVALPRFTDERFNNIFFSDALNGIILGFYGELFKTTDGGISWSLINTGTSEGFFDLKHISGNYLVASATNGVFAISSDFGSSWNFHNTGLTENLSAIHFTDNNNGYGFSQSLKLYKTSNGGLTWQQVPDMPASYIPTAMAGSADGMVYLTCRLNKVLKYSPTSLWQQVQLQAAPSLNSVDSFNRNYVYCAANSGLIVYSFNGGSTWTYENIGTNSNLNKIQFAKDSSAWAAGDNGTVAKSTNRGQAWQLIETPVTVNLNSIYAFNKFTAIAVGDSGTIIYTADGGKKWQIIPSPSSENLNDIGFFLLNVDGFIVGNNGVLLMTSDAGLSWTLRDIGFVGNFHKAFTLSNLGTAISDSGKIIATANGGVLWTEKRVPNVSHISGGKYYNHTTYTLLTGTGSVITVGITNLSVANYYVNSTGLYMNDVLIYDSKSVSLVSRNGIMMRHWQSTDPGIPVELTSFAGQNIDGKIQLNWSTATETNNRGFEVQKLFNTNEWLNIGFVSGSGTSTEPSSYSFTDSYPAKGVIHYRLRQIDYDGNAEILPQIEVGFDITFELWQNYPNPFNPETEITYSIPQTADVALVVYDALGAETARLVNKRQEPGKYSVRFNAASLPSGIYYCRLSSGLYTHVRKMILIK